MPELPEVETVRRGLEPVLAGRVLAHVDQRQTAALHWIVAIVRLPAGNHVDRLADDAVERLDPAEHVRRQQPLDSRVLGAEAVMERDLEEGGRNTRAYLKRAREAMNSVEKMASDVIEVARLEESQAIVVENL